MELGFPNKSYFWGSGDKNCGVIHCNHDNNNILHSRSNIVKLRSGDKSFNWTKCAFNDEGDNCTIMQMAQLYNLFYCYKNNKYINALLKCELLNIVWVISSTLISYFFFTYRIICLTILYKSPQFWNKMIYCSKLQFHNWTKLWWIFGGLFFYFCVFKITFYTDFTSLKKKRKDY